jgi:hypothetical protein
MGHCAGFAQVQWVHCTASVSVLWAAAQILVSREPQRGPASNRVWVRSQIHLLTMYPRAFGCVSCVSTCMWLCINVHVAVYQRACSCVSTCMWLCINVHVAVINVHVAVYPHACGWRLLLHMSGYIKNFFLTNYGEFAETFVIFSCCWTTGNIEMSRFFFRWKPDKNVLCVN